MSTQVGGLKTYVINHNLECNAQSWMRNASNLLWVITRWADWCWSLHVWHALPENICAPPKHEDSRYTNPPGLILG